MSLPPSFPSLSLSLHNLCEYVLSVPQVSVWSNNYLMASKEAERPSEMKQLMDWLKTNTPSGQQPKSEWAEFHTIMGGVLHIKYNIILLYIWNFYLQLLFTEILRLTMSFFTPLR